MPAKYDYAQNREFELETAIVSPLLCDTHLPREHIERQLRNLFYRVGKVIILESEISAPDSLAEATPKSDDDLLPG